jgi:YggT family protein
VITIVFDVIREILRIYFWIVILAAIFMTLSSFGVLDTRNRVVWMIGDFLYRATEPVLRPIRRILPNFGGIDFSPWIVCLIIQLVLIPVVVRVEYAIVYGNTSALLF